MANDLSKWADDNSMFFKLEVGESVVAVFKGYRIITNKFDPKKETVEYTLEINGEDKVWTNGSGSVAKTMSKLEVGANVAITKVSTPNGMGKYQISVDGTVSAPKTVLYNKKAQQVVERSTVGVVRTENLPNLNPTLDDPFGESSASTDIADEEDTEESEEELELKLKLARAKAAKAKTAKK